MIRITRAKRVGIQDVAKAAGVSASTVSAVLNNNYEKIRISEKTRERVLDAAHELRYTTNLYARRLASDPSGGNTPTVCIFWETESYHLSLRRFLEGINRYIDSSGHDFDYVICPYATGKLYKRERHITSGLYHGMIFVSLTDADEEYLKTVRIRAPHVCMNRESVNGSAIVVDHYATGRMAAQCLLRHAPLSMVQISPRGLSERNESIRKAAFLGECEKAGIPREHTLGIYTHDSAEGGYIAAQSLFARDLPRPMGLFVSSDVALPGVMRCISELGIRVARDVFVVTYGDVVPDMYSAATITSVRLPVEDMSCDCMLMIDHMLRGEELEGHIKVHQPVLDYGDSAPDLPGTIIPTKEGSP